MTLFRKSRPAEWQHSAERSTLDLTPDLRAVAWFSGA